MYELCSENFISILYEYFTRMVRENQNKFIYKIDIK